MQRMSGAVLKDIRNMRKHHTYASPDTAENRVARQSKQIRTETKFIMGDEYREKEIKIKALDEKLEEHKNQIEKNNEMIGDLAKSLDVLRQQLLEQTQLTEVEIKKNRQLRDEMQRTNRLLRNKNNKIEELTKKLELVEKQNQDMKSAVSKTDELTKNLMNARRQSANLQKSLEEMTIQRKSNLKDKDTQIQNLKENLIKLKTRQSEEEDLRRLLDLKDNQLHVLRSENSNIVLRLEKESQERQQFKQQYDTTKRQLDLALENQKIYSTQQKRYQEERRECQQIREQLKAMTVKCQDLRIAQAKIRQKDIEIIELKTKYSEKADTLDRSKNLFEKIVRQKDAIIGALQQKIANQTKEIEDAKQSISIFSKSAGQLETIRTKADQLNALYNALLPPLQCNLCKHSLEKPITVIPCGHNYCLGCKKGYTNKCHLCGDKVKIQAVYRNELLDDIANVVKNIKQLIGMLR